MSRSRKSLFGSLFGLSPRRQPKRRRSRKSSVGVESLEVRALLATLSVDLGDADCSADGPVYCQIHQAVDAASSGDHIKVHAGTYEPFEITKDGLTIREANANSNPIIDASEGLIAVRIAADNVTVRGLEAQNAFSEEDDAYGFLVTGSNNWLIGNAAVDNFHGFGIEGFEDGGDRNVLIGNTATGSDAGFEVVFGADDNTFINNTANENVLGFIEIASSDNTYISNTANSNSGVEDGVGFAFVGVTGARLTGNIANDNKLFGFVIVPFGEDQSHNNTFIGNTANGNGDCGFLIGGSRDNTFIGNTANDNVNFGYAVFDSTDSTFIGNTADDNDIGFFVDPLDEGSIFKGNSCKGNDTSGDNQDGLIC